MSAAAASAHAPAAGMVDGEFAFTSERLRRHRHDALRATRASTCRTPRRRWSIRASPSACARWASRASTTTARWSAADEGVDERSDAGGADHQRHALLPRAASFRPSARQVLPPLLERGDAGRPRAHLVGRLLQRAGALFDRADRAVADARRAPTTTSRSWPPTSIRTWSPTAAQGVYGEEAVEPCPADLRKRWLRASAAIGDACGRRRGCAQPGHLPRAQPDRRLADEGPVRRHLLPQRRDLFRRADPGRVWSAASPRC